MKFSTLIALAALACAPIAHAQQVIRLSTTTSTENSGLLAHAENVASRRSVAFTFLSALATGLGFLLAFIALGAFREIVGHGTLLSGIDLLAGERSRSLTIELPVGGMLVAILPPGAFFGMGLLLALRNRLSRVAPSDATPPGTPR